MTDIIKIFGAIAAIIGTCYSISNSKRSIFKKIKRKEEKVRKIEHEQILRYGLNRGSGHPLTNLDIKKDKLNNQIEELKDIIIFFSYEF